MISFIYSLPLKLLYPTSVSLILLLATTALRRHDRLSRVCCVVAVAVLMACGNGWVVKYSTRYLKRQYQVLQVDSTTRRCDVHEYLGIAYYKLSGRMSKSIECLS